MTRRRSSPPRPVAAPAPGLRLRQEVHRALRDLRDVGLDDEPAIQLVNDSLHGVLAYTAARGETCQVARAVNAVREAEWHLAAHHPEHACTALEKALNLLPDR